MTSRPPPTPFFTCTHAYFWRRLMWDGGQSWSFVPDNLYLICHGSALGCTMLYILLSEKKWMCFVSHTMYIDWQSKLLKDCSRSLITLHSHWLLLACVIHLCLCSEFSIVQSVWVRRSCWHSKSLSIRIKYFLLLKLYCICTVFAMYSNQKIHAASVLFLYALNTGIFNLRLHGTWYGGLGIK